MRRSAKWTSSSTERCLGGFALLAAPAQYRVTGIQTFMVGSSGGVYQKDLGRDTLAVFEKIDRFTLGESYE